MPWAARRRFVILSILGAFALAVIAVVAIAAFHTTPSCTDGVQNQGEQGVDCGGPCPYLCTADEAAPTVLFTRVVPSGAGRFDILALVENGNADAAAKEVPYTVSLYGADRAIAQTLSGSLELPPASIVPVFIPSAFPAASAFLSVGAAAWYRLPRDPRALPTVSNTLVGGSMSAPSIRATLENDTAAAMERVKAIVVVRAADGAVVAASQTIVPRIPPRGSADATFTWSAAFSTPLASVQVFPIIPLP